MLTAKALDILRRALLGLVFCLVLPLGALAQSEPDYDAWTKTADRAEVVLDQDWAAESALETLRAEISDYRSQFQRVQSANQERITTLKAQIAALGQAPENGTEPQEIASRRADLQKQLDDLEVPRVRADEAYSRADGLIGEIDGLLRKRQAEKLTSLDPAPLNPANWPVAGKTALDYVRNVAAETKEGFSADEVRADFRKSLLPALALVIVGLVLILRAPAWVEHLAGLAWQRFKRGPGVWGFGISLGQIALPLLGIVILVSAVRIANVAGPRGNDLLGDLIGAVAIVMGGRWLAAMVFPSGEGRALLDLKASCLKPARRNASILALLTALYAIAMTIGEREGAAAAAMSVSLFPLSLVTSFYLYRLARTLRGGMCHPAEGQTEAPNYLDQLFGLLLRVVTLVAFLSPLLAMVGYRNAAEQLLFPTILTLGLMALVRILQTLVRDLFTLITNHPEGDDEGLFPVIASVLLAFAAIPPLALIWGARISDLTELWARFRAGFQIGETKISPSDFLSFAIIFAIGFGVTRLVQGLLRNIVLPKTRLDVGGKTAVISGVGYIGVFVAALAAITGAGLDLSSLAIVAGALSVGIGFGLQNIVSNFVSGIILLIERPISEGDWIEVGGKMGYVRSISVRSTRVETFDRTDVIVPNADLVSGMVTNWTRGNSIGRVIVPVGVAYGTDTRRVESILMEIAKEHPMVLLQPPPFIYFKGFGDSSLDFEIRAIIRDVNWVLNVGSEMNHEIARRFAEAGIEIPFPQRDVWMRSAPAAAAPAEPLKTAPEQSPQGLQDPQEGTDT